MTPENTETSDRLTYATAVEFHQEIARLHGVTARLQAEIERLRARPCPYVTGNLTRYCTLTPFTLTDAERALIEMLADHPVTHEIMPNEVATLRGLLERTQFAKRESDRPQPIATRESDRPKPIADARLAARLAALQQLAELDEELDLPRCTPNPHATPGECTVPTART